MLRAFLTGFLVVSAAWITPPASAAGEKGWFGMSVNVEADGISLNPTIQAIHVEKVWPSSPASSVGLAQGDEILEVQGVVVAGAKADVLKTAMRKSVGESLQLKVRRGADAPRTVHLVAVAKPSGT